MRFCKNKLLLISMFAIFLIGVGPKVYGAYSYMPMLGYVGVDYEFENKKADFYYRLLDLSKNDARKYFFDSNLRPVFIYKTAYGLITAMFEWIRDIHGEESLDAKKDLAKVLPFVKSSDFYEKNIYLANSYTDICNLPGEGNRRFLKFWLMLKIRLRVGHDSPDYKAQLELMIAGCERALWDKYKTEKTGWGLSWTLSKTEEVFDENTAKSDALRELMLGIEPENFEALLSEGKFEALENYFILMQSLKFKIKLFKDYDKKLDLDWRDLESKLREEIVQKCLVDEDRYTSESNLWLYGELSERLPEGLRLVDADGNSLAGIMPKLANLHEAVRLDFCAIDIWIVYNFSNTISLLPLSLKSALFYQAKYYNNIVLHEKNSALIVKLLKLMINEKISFDSGPKILVAAFNLIHLTMSTFDAFVTMLKMKGFQVESYYLFGFNFDNILNRSDAVIVVSAPLFDKFYPTFSNDKERFVDDNDVKEQLARKPVFGVNIFNEGPDKSSNVSKEKYASIKRAFREMGFRKSDIAFIFSNAYYGINAPSTEYPKLNRYFDRLNGFLDGLKGEHANVAAGPISGSDVVVPIVQLSPAPAPVVKVGASRIQPAPAPAPVQSRVQPAPAPARVQPASAPVPAPSPAKSQQAFVPVPTNPTVQLPDSDDNTKILLATFSSVEKGHSFILIFKKYLENLNFVVDIGGFADADFGQKVGNADKIILTTISTPNIHKTVKDKFDSLVKSKPFLGVILMSKSPQLEDKLELEVYDRVSQLNRLTPKFNYSVVCVTKNEIEEPSQDSKKLYNSFGILQSFIRGRQPSVQPSPATVPTRSPARVQPAPAPASAQPSPVPVKASAPVSNLTGKPSAYVSTKPRVEGVAGAPKVLLFGIGTIGANLSAAIKRLLEHFGLNVFLCVERSARILQRLGGNNSFEEIAKDKLLQEIAQYGKFDAIIGMYQPSTGRYFNSFEKFKEDYSFFSYCLNQIGDKSKTFFFGLPYGDGINVSSAKPDANVVGVSLSDVIYYKATPYTFNLDQLNTTRTALRDCSKFFYTVLSRIIGKDVKREDLGSTDFGFAPDKVYFGIRV